MSVLDIWTGLCFMVFKTLFNNRTYFNEPRAVYAFHWFRFKILIRDLISSESDRGTGSIEIYCSSRFCPNTKPEMSRQAHIVSRSKMATLLIGDRWLIKREDGTTLFSKPEMCPNNVWPDTPLNIHNYTNVKLVAIPKVLYHQENARLLVHLYLHELQEKRKREK